MIGTCNRIPIVTIVRHLKIIAETIVARTQLPRRFVGSIGTISSQDIDALLFFQWAKNYLHNQSKTNFLRFPILTGHSLGGYFAQLIASNCSITTAAINKSLSPMLTTNSLPSPARLSAAS